MPSLSHSPLTGPIPRPADPHYVQERKVLSFDVAFWPVERPHMRSPRAITERLMEDLLSLHPDETSPPVTGEQLQAMGWTLAQLQAHSHDALTALADARARDLGNEVA
jgi:hypothetical protein